MIKPLYISSKVFKASALKVAVCFCIVYISLNVRAQQQPPRPMKAIKYQDLSFGSIIQGNAGGTVIISTSGIRSKTGDVILPSMGSPENEAIFEVKAAPGTLITVVFGSTTLTNGAHSMNLVLGPSFPASPFINTLQPTGVTMVHLGGTLTVGNSTANPAGNYSGSFTVTFIQQ
jgi:hypothetical protein